MTQEYKGTALITGASTGIGAIFADRLAQRGYDLILVARNRDGLNALASRLTNETQQSVEVFPADLANAADLARVERKLREDASINLLVNNAGIGTHTSLLDSDVERMAEMISLNVTALTRLTYAAVPGFIARQQGAIINMSSYRQPGTGNSEWRVWRKQSLRHSLHSVAAQGAGRTGHQDSGGTARSYGYRFLGDRGAARREP